jgi:Crp-like helix-turn-helix domain
MSRRKLASGDSSAHPSASSWAGQVGSHNHSPDAAHDWFLVSGPATCIISLITEMENGYSVESAGLPSFLRADVSRIKAVEQIPGMAFRVGVDSFRTMLVDVSFASAIGRYADAAFSLTVQSTACKALHRVEKRLARWLLMTQDRAGADSLPLTQDVIATMLGVARPTVSTSARTLQMAGLIRYSHAG